MARKIQAELSFQDSLWFGDCGPTDAVAQRQLRELSRPARVDSSFNLPTPEPKRGSMKVICLECSRQFSTRSFLPTCPGCGGSDVEPR